MFVWRRRAIRSAIERYSGLIGLLEPTIRAPALLAHAYEQLKPVSIDVALMESAARDGKVVMGSMDVGWSDIGSWTELLAAVSAGGTGSVVQPGDRIDVNADDLVVRRADGAVRVIRPLQAGSMTATQPIAVLRGADPRVGRGAPRALCPMGGGPVTETAVTGADPDRVRHRRLAGPDRRRVHVRERPPLRRRRRALRRGARRPGEGRRHRLRPPVRLGALRAGRRRGPAGARHPGRDQQRRGPDPDELVRGRPARLGRRHRDHGLAQPVDRQRVQGQVADGRRRRGATCCRRSRPRSTPTPARRSSADRSRTRRPRASSSGSTRSRATSGSSAGRSTSTRCGPPTSRCSSSRCTARAPAGSRRLLAGGRIRVTEIHNERNPYFGGVNPEPIRPNVDEALALIAGGGYDLGLLLDGDADRAGAADERGTFLHQLEVTGLLMYYLAEHRGMRDPVVVVGEQHVDGRDARAALRDRDVRGPGRASSSSGRR